MATYTVSSAGGLRLNENSRISSILQNISVILRTPRGSVPFYRDFGLDMSYKDAPAPIAASYLISAVNDAIDRYEPRAICRGVTILHDNNGVLYPVVEVEISEES